jgi:ABC-type branched-subunit amino acid transport system ATPase component
MLELRKLRVRYGPIEALRGVDLVARTGTVTAVLGANGAGKSFLMKAPASSRRRAAFALTARTSPIFPRMNAPGAASRTRWRGGGCSIQ